MGIKKTLPHMDYLRVEWEKLESDRKTLRRRLEQEMQATLEGAQRRIRVEVAKAVAQGESKASIANTIGVTPQTIYRWLADVEADETLKRLADEAAEREVEATPEPVSHTTARRSQRQGDIIELFHDDNPREVWFYSTSVGKFRAPEGPRPYKDWPDWMQADAVDAVRNLLTDDEVPVFEREEWMRVEAQPVGVSMRGVGL